MKNPLYCVHTHNRTLINVCVCVCSLTALPASRIIKINAFLIKHW